MTIALAVLAAVAGAAAMGYWLERQRRLAAERIAGTAWASVPPTPPPAPTESLEARALRIEGERTKTTVVDRLQMAGLSEREARRLWAVANGEQAP